MPDRPHPGGAGGGLSQLRQGRQELLTELSRSRYLHRLVQAQMDLTVAGLTRLPEPARSRWLGMPTPPSAAEVHSLLAMPGQDVCSRLEALRQALHRLARYDDALSGACCRATDELVTSLLERPSACL